MATGDDQADPLLGDVQALGRGGDVDMATFGQILEMDDSEDDREFSLSIVSGFFEQAQETFDSMQEALDDKNLAKLAQLGHFLKGSSATLGLIKVKDHCHKIERYGKNEATDGGKGTLSEEELLSVIGSVLAELRADYATAEDKLQSFFGTA